MDLEAFRDLLEPAGQKALAQAVELAEAGADPIVAATTLRRSHPPELTAAALTQASLRRRAEAKFGPDAAVMYFTPHGLEQATRAEVAAHRARRARLLIAPATTSDPASATTSGPAPSPEPPAGPAAHPATGPIARVLDVCCGVGGDVIALARAGFAVDAVDLDPLTVEVARANAAALGLSSLVGVRTADAVETDPSDYDLLFADPARRGARGRIFDPMAYSPTWPAVLDLVSRTRTACLKVAPGIPHELVPEGAEAEWISHRREVKEAAIWVGTRASGRRATMLPSGETLTSSGAGAEAGPVGRYLYEPDGAAVRAHLVAEVAAMVGGRLLDPRIAYITGDSRVPTQWASCYEVADMMPFSLKHLRSVLRNRKVGNVTIKKRGSAVDIERLRKDLRLSGGNSAVVVLTRIDDRPYVLLCDPADLH
ncbi:class I SAM-dependent methyltransferase [Planotetraspora kaengkrachanensis]|uniref:Methyltransferase n=1 Tax=Planotetraspora kaengkrachanensis TaxID=575193 RepID=A0A8J3PWK1_9ACTN|nr:class I SAM-dependent methyltransferase [Planotetraspora kaengkrachanensis]GIG82395.1 methyltransferase [Planotetraspora kaengkrachanensis]